MCGEELMGGAWRRSKGGVTGVDPARRGLPMENTLAYAVCDSNGKALDDNTLKQNKLRFQKATRRIVTV